MPSIIIEEQGRPQPAPPRVESRMDLQDYLLIAGVVFAEAAALVIWWPAALILAAMLCFGFALLIEKSKSRKKAGK
jgi:hypothetical protein